MKLLGWIQRKQNERRCRAQGFRPKLCQAMRWKEENNRIGQLLGSEFRSTSVGTSKAGTKERREYQRESATCVMWTAGVLQTANRNVFGQPHRTLEHNRNRPVLRWPGLFASRARNLTGRALRVTDLEMEALVSELERSLAGTKGQGGRGTVPKPIGSIRSRWEFTSRSNQEHLEARSTEQLIANGRERIIHSDGYSLAVRFWSGSWNCATQLQIWDAHG